jgi:hypothetical protein
MKIKTLLALAGWLSVGSLLADPQPIYENLGTQTNNVQVDAVAFANYGWFVTDTPALWDGQNTRYWTNRGTMTGNPGFRFDYVNDAGFRQPSDSFFNGPGASITVQEGVDMVAGLRINATNIITRNSILESDITGIIQILGHNADLSRTMISIDPVVNSRGFQEYYPFYDYADAYGISDLYWGFGEELPRVFSSTLVSSYAGVIVAEAPGPCVTNANPGQCMGNAFFLSSPATFVFTNWSYVDTNLMFTVSLGVLGVVDTNLSVTARFYPSDQPTNFYSSIAFQMGTVLTNTASQSQDLYHLYLTDRMAAEGTNVAVLLTNLLTRDIPYRPGAYEFSRSPSIEYAFGGNPNATNGWYTNKNNIGQLVYGTTNIASLIFTNIASGGSSFTNVVTNFVVTPNPPTSTNYEEDIVTNIVFVSRYYYNQMTNAYAAYGAFVTNNEPIVPFSPVASITNAEGRVEINTDVLDMESTRIRAEGNITIATRHLVGSANAGVDCQSLYYDLGSTNGLLKLQNLALPVVQRLSGNVYAWTGAWTNFFDIVTNTFTNAFITNIAIDPTTGTNLTTITNVPGTNTFYTNTVQVNLNVSMVDGTTLQTRWPTAVNGLATRSTNVFLADTMRVVDSLYVDGTSLTVSTNGQFFAGDYFTAGAIQDWNTLDFPNLLYLTNNGLIAVPNVADFGTAARPYQEIVNTGTNAAFAVHYYANDIQLGGTTATWVIGVASDGSLITYSAPGSIQVNANTAKLENGVLNAYYDIVLTAGSLKMRNATNTAGGVIQLAVTGDLSDSGPDANVVLDCAEGIQLTTKPATGALLGTTINVNAPNFQSVDSVWAAEDRGAHARGFTNNAAVGHLFLNPGRDGQVTFGPVSAANAMYVDYLEFSPTAQADLKDSVLVKPGFTIYYASANLTVDQLTAAFGNQMQPVLDFVGPHSGMPVVVTLDPNSNPPKQVSVYVNSLLRNSTTIDSDGNGTANGYELDPFKGPKMSVAITNLPPLSVAITWNVAAQTVYHVDYATQLGGANWQPLVTYTNTLNTATNATIYDPAGGTNAPRYYRVSYSPYGTGL